MVIALPSHLILLIAKYFNECGLVFVFHANVFLTGYSRVASLPEVYCIYQCISFCHKCKSQYVLSF